MKITRRQLKQRIRRILRESNGQVSMGAQDERVRFAAQLHTAKVSRRSIAGGPLDGTPVSNESEALEAMGKWSSTQDTSLMSTAFKTAFGTTGKLSVPQEAKAAATERLEALFIRTDTTYSKDARSGSISSDIIKGSGGSVYSDANKNIQPTHPFLAILGGETAAVAAAAIAAAVGLNGDGLVDSTIQSASGLSTYGYAQKLELFICFYVAYVTSTPARHADAAGADIIDDVGNIYEVKSSTTSTYQQELNKTPLSVGNATMRKFYMFSRKNNNQHEVICVEAALYTLYAFTTGVEDLENKDSPLAVAYELLGANPDEQTITNLQVAIRSQHQKISQQMQQQIPQLVKGVLGKIYDHNITPDQKLIDSALPDVGSQLNLYFDVGNQKVRITYSFGLVGDRTAQTAIPTDIRTPEAQDLLARATAGQMPQEEIPPESTQDISYSDEDDPAARWLSQYGGDLDNLKENNIYENILKKILYTAKKRQ